MAVNTDMRKSSEKGSSSSSMTTKLDTLIGEIGKCCAKGVWGNAKAIVLCREWEQRRRSGYPSLKTRLSPVTVVGVILKLAGPPLAPGVYSGIYISLRICELGNIPLLLPYHRGYATFRCFPSFNCLPRAWGDLSRSTSALEWTFHRLDATFKLILVTGVELVLSTRRYPSSRY